MTYARSQVKAPLASLRSGLRSKMALGRGSSTSTGGSGAASAGGGGRGKPPGGGGDNGGRKNGLRYATPGLLELYAKGSLNNLTYQEVTDVLEKNGFKPRKAEKGEGVLYEKTVKASAAKKLRTDSVEQVRIMEFVQGRGWRVRIQNSHNNPLDHEGNVDNSEGQGPAHDIYIKP